MCGQITSTGHRTRNIATAQVICSFYSCNDTGNHRHGGVDGDGSGQSHWKQCSRGKVLNIMLPRQRSCAMDAECERDEERASGVRRWATNPG